MKYGHRNFVTKSLLKVLATFCVSDIIFLPSFNINLLVIIILFGKFGITAPQKFLLLVM